MKEVAIMKDLYPRDYRRYEGSRFAVELSEFAQWLRKLGYTRHCLRGHLFRLKKILEGSERFQPAGAFRDTDLREVFTIVSPCAAEYRGTQRAFERFLFAAGRLTRAVPMNAMEVLCQRYCQYLSEVRGFAAATVQQHLSTSQDLLSRGLPGGAELAGLTAADVESYVQIKSKEVSRQTLQHVVGHLRAFLRYCADHAQTKRGLDCIDTPRTYRGELPPRALDWELVRRLLVSVDRKSRNGWRDHAILHLMAYYGLRPSEIVSLDLSSIDWDAQTIRVEQCKTQSILVLPLAPRTLRMLRHYVIAGRPSCDEPQLFLRSRCPIRAMKHYAVGNIFAKRAQQSGLPLQGTSPYTLRHSFAMRLLRRGVGVKAIGDLLGHRSLESTCVYLRLDIDMLRTVALPVPTAAAA
jgi:site-specific recombinase XerD